MAVQTDIANVEARRVRGAVKRIQPSKQDLRHLGKGNLAGMMTGKGILNEMQERGGELEGKQQRRPPPALPLAL